MTIPVTIQFGLETRESSQGFSPFWATSHTESEHMKVTKPASGTVDWRPNKGGRWVAKITHNGRRFLEEMVDETGAPLFTTRDQRSAALRCAREMAQTFRDPTLPISPKLVKSITVAEWGNEWTSGRLFQKYGNVSKLKQKKSAADDAGLLKLYVYPRLGDRPVASIEESDIERTFANGWAMFRERWNREPSARTKTQVYQATRRLFDLAIRPGRIRDTNPVHPSLKPSGKSEKLYAFLYPSELLALLACTEVPIERRVYYATATYTGLRKGSLRVPGQEDPRRDEPGLEYFTWDAIDFDNSTILALNTKPGVPLMFAQSDPGLPGINSLMELLRRWREYNGWPSDDKPFVDTLYCRPRMEAQALRDDLRAASIGRNMLHRRSDKMQPMRFHDLRATFVTWALRAGKTSGWIRDRTGHIDDRVMERYIRGARNIHDLKLSPGPFPDISLAIPELADIKVARLPTSRR